MMPLQPARAARETDARVSGARTLTERPAAAGRRNDRRDRREGADCRKATVKETEERGGTDPWGLA